MMDHDLHALLVSPCCRLTLNSEPSQLLCPGCGSSFEFCSDIPCLAQARAPDFDRETNLCDVSVLVMTRNEAGNIARQLHSATRVLDCLSLSFELIVVDGNSEDSTVAEAEAAGAKVESQSEPGYGSAFRQGLRACRGEWILTIDADGSHDPNFFRTVWANRHGAELVIASRYAGGHSQMPTSRLVMSRLLNGAFSHLLRVPVKDLSSGFRLYRRSALSRVELTGRDFNVLIELLVKLYNQGSKIVEVPFFYKPRGEGRSKAQLLRFAASYLRSLASLTKLRGSEQAGDFSSQRPRWYEVARQRELERAFQDSLELLDGQREDILHLFCGSGKLVRFLPGAIAVDSRLSKLRFLRNVHSRLVEARMDRLPFADASFGTVVAIEPERRTLTKEEIREVTRVIQPGGHLIASASLLAQNKGENGPVGFDSEKVVCGDLLRYQRDRF